jgi:hypothetical protein
MIRLQDILRESAHEDVVKMIAANFDTILGNYEEWLEGQLDDLVEDGSITPWNRYDTLMALRDNSDSAEEFAAYIKHRHKLYDPVQLSEFIARYSDYGNI